MKKQNSQINEINKDEIFVVVPAFNEEKMIGETLKNLKKEGYKNIVVVDDGSMDKTSEIAKKREL